MCSNRIYQGSNKVSEYFYEYKVKDKHIKEILKTRRYLQHSSYIKIFISQKVFSYHKKYFHITKRISISQKYFHIKKICFSFRN